MIKKIFKFYQLVGISTEINLVTFKILFINNLLCSITLNLNQTFEELKNNVFIELNNKMIIPTIDYITLIIDSYIIPDYTIINLNETIENMLIKSNISKPLYYNLSFLYYI
jgi:hypothetical protein